MTSAGRPWDPPVPRDPTSFPPSAFAGVGAASVAGRESSEAGHPPSAFSHVPPGGFHAGSDTNSTASLVDPSLAASEKRSQYTYGQGTPRLPALVPPGPLHDDGRRDSTSSATRFIRHEDAGLVESAGGGSGGETEEVVDLPPLYEQARGHQRAAEAKASRPTEQPRLEAVERGHDQ